jgi:xylulokinase
LTTALLGIDLGAGSLKATLVDAQQGRVLASASQAITTYRPQPGWSEQDPDEWYQALCGAVRQARYEAGLATSHIKALAVSAGAHIPVLLDAADRPLRPAILWNDQRSVLEAAELREQHGELIEQTSLNRANPTWTLAMLAWLGKHEPDVLQGTQRLCLAKDYLRLRLTGEWASDYSDAVGALLADNQTRNWSAALSGLIDWPLAKLPPLKPATAIAGQITQQAAQDTGLACGTPVITGSNDTTVELFGVGALTPGQAAIKLATAGVLFLTVDRPVIRPPISCYPHLVDGLYYLATGTNACASAHRWARDTLLPELSFEQFDSLANTASAGSAGLIFHPYLQGERGPHWNPHLRGNFIGLTIQHERQHFARAVYEGIAYSINDLLHDARSKDLQFGTARLLGGGTRSSLWRQILADVTGLLMEIPATADASFGSALVAGIGVGLFSTPQDAVDRCVEIVAYAEPNPARHALYAELFAVYQQAQQALAGLDENIGQIINKHHKGSAFDSSKRHS